MITVEYVFVSHDGSDGGGASGMGIYDILTNIIRGSKTILTCMETQGQSRSWQHQ